MRHRTILLALSILAACGGPPGATNGKRQQSAAETRSTSEPATEQIPPVEFGRRPPNTPMTSKNMPLFDTVTYCLLATRGIDRIPKGPAYETCVEDQENYRIVIGEAIDENKFAEDAIVRCAKASRTAYEGLWFCVNEQPFRTR